MFSDVMQKCHLPPRLACFQTNDDVVDRVVKHCALVMKKLCTLKLSAELRNLTELAPKKFNKTRWRGKFQTCLRYLELERHLKKIDSLKEFLILESYEDEVASEELEDVADDNTRRKFKFKRCTRDELKAVVLMLAEQDEACLELQAEGLTLAQADDLCEMAADLLDAKIVSADQPFLSSHKIGHLRAGTCPLSDRFRKFEDAVKKLQKGEQLTVFDKSHLAKLKKPPATAIPAQTDTPMLSPDSTFKAKLKATRKSFSQAAKTAIMPPSEVRTTEFIDPGFILGTSVAVERFFSHCKLVLRDSRKGMTPMMFECVMFLKANINEWDLNFVAQALAGKDHKVAENNADFELVAGMMEGLDVMEED